MKHLTFIHNILLRSLTGEGVGSTLQYSCLKNPMDRGVWQATVHRVAQSWTLLCENNWRIITL